MSDSDGLICVLYTVRCFGCRKPQSALQATSIVNAVREFQGMGWKIHRKKWYCRPCIEKLEDT